MNTIKFNSRLLSLMALLFASMTLVTSCKKDDAVAKSSETVLLSFGPTGAKHGDTLRFIGNNLNTVTEIQLTGASVPQSAFLKQTSELILIIVPKETVKGFVTLKTPKGDIVTKTILNLDVSIMVTSIPREAKPGANITITGNYLNWVNAVTFANGKIADSASIVSKTLTQLVVTVPKDAQTGKLILSYGGTEWGELETDSTLIVTLPSITSMAPNPIKHADNLTITGQNLDLTWGVLFNGVSQADTVMVSKSATSIVVKIPAGAKQGKVTLVAASKVKVESTADLMLMMPAVTDLSPNPVAALGDLTITGTNLNLVSGILFNGATANVTTFISQSPTTIIVKLPAGAKRGKVILSVLNSTLTVEAPMILTFIGDLLPLAPMDYLMYDDQFRNNWQDWGWNRTADYANTENVREGTKSMKYTYTAQWSGVKFANGNVATATYKEVAFSLYGGPGTNGKKIKVTANGNGASAQEITIVEGEWREFKFNFTAIGNPANLTELILGNEDWTGVIYVDQLGLRKP